MIFKKYINRKILRNIFNKKLSKLLISSHEIFDYSYFIEVNVIEYFMFHQMMTKHDSPM